MTGDQISFSDIAQLSDYDTESYERVTRVTNGECEAVVLDLDGQQKVFSESPYCQNYQLNTLKGHKVSRDTVITVTCVVTGRPYEIYIDAVPRADHVEKVET